MKSFSKEVVKMNNKKRRKIFFHVLVFCISLESKKTVMRVAAKLFTKFCMQPHIFKNMENKIHFSVSEILIRKTKQTMKH